MTQQLAKPDGLTLADMRDAYYYNSGKASDISRQLALASLALVWLFGSGSVTPTRIPPDLILAGFFSTASLALDLIQYMWASACWSIYSRFKEGKVSAEDRFKVPFVINWPTILCFWSKTLLLIAAYVMIGSHLWWKLKL